MSNWWNDSPSASPPTPRSGGGVDVRCGHRTQHLRAGVQQRQEHEDEHLQVPVVDSKSFQGQFTRVADKGWNIDDPIHNARAGIRFHQADARLAGGDPGFNTAPATTRPGRPEGPAGHVPCQTAPSECAKYAGVRGPSRRTAAEGKWCRPWRMGASGSFLPRARTMHRQHSPRLQPQRLGENGGSRRPLDVQQPQKPKESKPGRSVAGDAIRPGGLDWFALCYWAREVCRHPHRRGHGGSILAWTLRSAKGEGRGFQRQRPRRHGAHRRRSTSS